MRWMCATVLGSVMAAGLTGGVAATRVVAGECGTEFQLAGVLGRTDGPLRSLLTLPSGDIIVGGKFTQITDANGTVVSANSVARWNGTSWSAMGSGLTGGFEGDNTGVNSLLALPNGDIVAGGTFTTSGNTTTNLVARWNGSTWQPLGGGIAPGTATSVNRVEALAVLPNGDIVAGGAIRNFLIGGSFGHVYRWNGSAWSTLSGGTTGPVYALAIEQGTGKLLVGGQFGNAGGIAVGNVATWSATIGWEAMGTGLPGGSSAVANFAYGSSGALHASGAFSTPQGVQGLARWNGSSWTVIAAPASTSGGLVAMSDGGFVTGSVRYRNGLLSTLNTSQAFNVAVRLAANGSDLIGVGTRVFSSGPGVVQRFTFDGPAIQVASPGLASEAICPQGNVTLRVAAYGRQPMTYQWRRNGETISIAANLTAQAPELVVGDVQSSDEGVYDCVVTSACGTVTSSGITVTRLPEGTPGCELSGCDTIDFNNNQIFPEDQDVVDLFFVFAGGECGSCNDIDYNNNGVFPEDQDIMDFFNVLAGGSFCQ
ncbi:MAG TPA: hypothetical protein VK157_13670 [Phycisphaerales bacterium]|nr:hypothetical protein [Phycisphaerales bacterium]